MASIQIDIKDGLSSSVAIKGPCRVATTANITLVGEQTIDGVAVVTDDRVLVKDQTTASDNGIYIADTGNWRRAKDFNKTKDVKTGTLVLVTSGTVGTGIWQVTTADPITVGTTSIAFSQTFLTAAQINALFQPLDADLTAIAALSTTTYGRSLLTMAAAVDVRDNLDVPPYVADRTALKAIDTTKDTVANLKESGREGQFVWRSGDYSTQVAADTVEAIFVKATAIAATAGAWVRMDGGWALSGIDVRWAGVLVDGLTASAAANTAALQTVSNLSYSLGTGLRFPASTVELYVTSGITVANRTQWRGTGAGNCIIKTTTSTGDVVTVSAINTEINFECEKITFSASGARSAGYYVNCNSAAGVRIDNCIFLGGYDCVGITGTPYQNFRINNCIMGNMAHNGVNVTATSAGQGAVDIVLSNLWMHGTSAGSQSACGVHIESAGDILLDHVSTIWCANPLEVVPGNGLVVQAMLLNKCFFDSGSGIGMYIGPTGTGVVQLLKAAETWACTNTGGGCVLGASTGTVLQSEFIGCTMSSNGGSGGLLINAVATNTTVLGGSYSGNTNHGIGVAANAGKFKIEGAICGPSGQFGANGGYGINIVAGTSDNYDILGCTVTGNTTGSISDNGSGTNKLIKNNRGYFTQAQGVISGTTDASGDLTVTHGMSITPTVAVVSKNGAVTTGECQSHTMGATTFKIRFWTSAGAADASVARQAMWTAYGPGALLG